MSWRGRRPQPQLVVLLPAFFLAFLLTLPGTLASPTIDAKSPDVLTGYLAWNGGAGTISWETPAGSDDDVNHRPDPHPTAVQNLKNTAGGYARSATGENPYRPPSFSYTSAQLPTMLHINVSRMFQLNLFLKTDPPPTIGQNYGHNCATNTKWDVEVFAGETRIAGGIHGRSDGPVFNQQLYHNVPTIPAGYCYYTHRFALEVPRLDAGTVLRVKIIPFSQNTPVLVGYAGNHHSHIVIPFYSADDYVFRTEVFAPLGESIEPDGAGGGEGETPGGLLALAALPILAFGRRPSRRTQAVAAVLVASTFAGCFGGSDAPAGPAGDDVTTGGSANQTIIEDATGTANGSLLGRILDEFRLPIGAVHVSLVGTARFADTAGDGRFSFKNLRSGTYQLRLDKKDFKSFETDVKIVPGAVTRLDVVLDAVKKGGGLDRHRHDYWGDKDVATLPELRIPSITCTHTICTPASLKFGEPSNPLDYNAILPGTESIDVKVSWDATGEGGKNELVRRVGFFVITNNWPYLSHSNSSDFYPRTNGETFTIRSNWEMTDKGHMHVSKWTFGVYIPEDQNTYANYAKNAVSKFGPVTISLTLHRGAMPVEPAHTGVWGDSPTLPLIDGKTQTPPSSTNGNTSWPLAPRRLVPPDTTWIEVLLRQDRAATYTDLDWNLVFHPGPNAPAGTGGSQTCTVVTNGEGNRVAPAGQRSGLTWSWRIPVTPSLADTAYSKTTNWCFWTYASSTNDYATYYYTEGYQTMPTYEPIRLNLTVVAHRDGAGGE